MKKTFRTDASDGGAAKDVDREIALHLELRTREFEAQGMTPEAARRAALDAFGDPAAVAAEVTGIRGDTLRGRRRRDWFLGLRQDLVVALRGLRRTPGFTLVALLTIALGIGANTALFGVLRGVLLRPLPYPNAGELVQLWTDHRAIGRAEPEWLSPGEFHDWRTQNRTFSTMAAYQGWAPDLTGAGDPAVLGGISVTGDFFEMLGVRPALGRLIGPVDDVPGGERTVVLSDAVWRTRFGADPAILGRSLTLNGEPWTVVGVLPAGFRPPLAVSPELYRGLPTPTCGHNCIIWRAIGRMKPGVTFAQAQADLRTVAARLAEQYPESNARVGAWPVPLHEQITGPTRAPLLALGGAVAFVFLIVCVNLANLLLVRGAGRGRELGVRSALGAGHGRIVRQLLTESAVLAAAGGALGLALGAAGTRALALLVPEPVRRLQEIALDGSLVLFAVGLTVGAAALFGVLPAFHAARADLMTALRSGGRETGRRGTVVRNGLVVAELALAVVLLVGAGLLFRSFLLLQRVDLGFRSDGLLVTQVAFPRARYTDTPRAAVAVDDLLARLRAHPAITRAEVTTRVPLDRGDGDVDARPVGETVRDDRPNVVWLRSVSTNYLQTMEMRLIAGRSFTPEDRQGSPPVGVVNETAAREFWGDKSPIGRQLAVGSDAPPITIVGVVASPRHDGPRQPYKVELFTPFEQVPARGVSIIIEPARDAPAAMAAYRSAIREVDPLLAIDRIDPIAQRVDEAVALPRLNATLVGLFAGVALLLAMLGVYGVMAYSVAQRRREIGVRIALGAAPSGIRRMVLGEGSRLAIIGTATGLVLAVVVGRTLDALLFGVRAFDLPTFVVVPLVLGTMAVVASWLPARRAMRVDPLTAIREE